MRDPLWMEGNDVDDDFDEMEEGLDEWGSDDGDNDEADPDRLHDGFYDD